MWSHQPAGPPVTATTEKPASYSRSRAVKAAAVRRPEVVSVPSTSVSTVVTAAR